MGMTKNLGGDRLGSGKKMQVHLHGYERSTHDLGYIWRSSMSAGTLVPFMKQVALPGDTFSIHLDCDIKTHPTIGPLFGSYKVQLDVFEAPMRLYMAPLHNNALGIGMNMASVKFPQMTLVNSPVDGAADIDNAQVNPSSLLAYLGVRGVGIGTPGGENQERNFNAIPLLAYWEIVKNYYANKQEELGAVIHTPVTAINTALDTVEVTYDNGTTTTNIPEAPLVTLVELRQGAGIAFTWTAGAADPNNVMVQLQYGGWRSASELGQVNPVTAGAIMVNYNAGRWGTDYAINWRLREPTDLTQVAPEVATFNLDNIDEMRMEILAAGNTPFEIDGTSPAPYGYVLAKTDDTPNALSSQEGLAVKTYQSDLFNNWLRTEWIEGPGSITAITAISTVGDQFTLDTLNLSKKVYDMLNRIAVSGGSFNDWQEAVYDHRAMTKAESPIYCGGLSKELVFQEVVSNSASAGESGSQPLGTLAGKGIMAKKHKGGHIEIKVDEPSYIIGIISLTPRVDYSQGNDWDTLLQSMDDLHKPALDEIGFQDLPTEQMAWWTAANGGGTWTNASAGKQPAWIQYMTNVNKTYGNFAIADNEMFMTLNRRFEYDAGAIQDLTTYIDPAKFNFIFAETALDAQNFWAQIAIDITARRKMSAKIMPNL